MAFVKPIRELGIVISKKHNEARAERTDMTGKLWPAKEEEFIIEVISCDEDDLKPDTGILNGTRAEYRVTKEVYDKVKFLDKAKVKYTASQYGEKLNIRPESFELIEKSK